MRAIILNSDRRISYNIINSKPNIKKGEYLVKVMYSPINPSDFGFSQNIYGKLPHKKYPIGLGFEGCGVIEESEEINLIGKKICFVVNYEKENFLGAWSDFTVINKNEFFILPDNFNDMKKAAYLFINPFTALSFIDIIRKSKYKCDSVIHTAGASALGRIFTKLCYRDKIRIINTVRKEKHLEELKSIGSTLTINTSSSTKDYKNELLLAKKEYNPKVAFECIGGEMTGNILNTLDEEGILYHYGNLSLKNCSNITTKDLIFLDKKISGFWLFKYLNNLPDQGQRIFQEFYEILNTQPEIFDTSIHGIFSPDKFEEAFKLYRSDMSKGKVLFDFSNNI